MRDRMWRVVKRVMVVGIVVATAGAAEAEERVGRGMVALRRDDGTVFVSWRKLRGDTEKTTFSVTQGRRTIVKNGRVTNAVDAKAPAGDVEYVLKVGRKEAGRATVGNEARAYVAVPLSGDFQFRNVGVADLDGDGEYEFLVRQPNFNTDPYQRPGYWKKSPTTYKIEAYETDGSLMWQYDMGWAIEAGMWYAPWIAYDVDGDGRAEVYCKAGDGDPREETGHVRSGPEYLAKIDGVTGEIVAKIDWIPREDYSSYNYASRNFLTVAYLDGKKPALILSRGTYRLIQTRAYDADFNLLWHWSADDETTKYRGQGSHGLVTADVDGDGRDELVLGAAVLDDNGKGLWSLEMGHPDVCHVADIDPDNPGLEIFYGFESRQETDGVTVVDAKTGRKLWALKEPTRHVHGQGMAADVLAEYPGMEVYAGERDLKKRWLYSAQGELISFTEEGGLSPRAVWWDADPQKEVIVRRDIADWGGEPITTVEGRAVAVVDCIGDFREEVLTSVDGELRIYSTTIPTAESRVHLMQDRQYRLGVAAQTMGYYYPAQLGE